jgi:mannose-6-phosphate isomerase-like protein (cupin superfamily)
MTNPAHRLASKSIFSQQPPQALGADGLSRTWITRGGNFAICVSQVEPGAVLELQANPEEYMLIIPPNGAAVRVEAGGEGVEAQPDSLTIVPPGASRIVARTGGLIARILSKAAEDVMALAVNADVYADGAPELAPVTLWPEPVGGYRIRHYPLAPYFKPDGDRIQPRCFRSTNMMVNLFGHFRTRRETTGLSPHWHDDFEQASLCFLGTWMHHLRYNWGANLAEWVPDDHAELATPSVIVIPAKVIHTSRDVGEDEAESALYDIFCPPRMDFAAKPGFVLNEDDYPLPANSGEQVVKTGGTLLNWQKPG